MRFKKKKRRTENEDNNQLPSIGYYRFLSAIQFGLGFLLLFFATYIVMNLHGEGNGTFPYYAGSFMTSIGIMGVSLVGVAIYDAGQQVYEPELVRRIRPLLLAHLCVSLVVIPLCVLGFILTIVYGLCPSTKCSYTTNKTFNYGMAAFLVVMHLLCLGALTFSLVLFRHNQKELPIHPKAQDREDM